MLPGSYMGGTGALNLRLLEVTKAHNAFNETCHLNIFFSSRIPSPSSTSTTQLPKSLQYYLLSTIIILLYTED